LVISVPDKVIYFCPRYKKPLRFFDERAFFYDEILRPTM
jgi:hypothetical protein